MEGAGSSSADFERVVGWETIFSLILAFGGLALAVWGPRAKAMRSSTQVADALSAQVLKDEGLALSELLYVGQDPGRAANLAFHQDVLLGADRVQGTLKGVSTYYRMHPTGRMVVLGTPGSGKTVLLLSLICQLGDYRKALDDSSRAAVPVPMRSDLAGWDVSVPLETWLAGEVAAAVRQSNLSGGSGPSHERIDPPRPRWPR